jgi:hypothetical protein
MSELEVRKRIVVERPRDEAFRLFTEGIGEWWPLRTHSVHEEQAARALFEPRIGGRVYEVASGGEEAEWGRVLAWDPPAGFTISWHPGRDPSAATEVSVRFEAETEQRTHIALVHRGWEALGEAASETRDGYDAGWDAVLGEYLAVRVG